MNALGLLTLSVMASMTLAIRKEVKCQKHEDCSDEEVCHEQKCAYICQDFTNCMPGDFCIEVKSIGYRVCKENRVRRKIIKMRSLMKECFEYGLHYPTLPLVSTRAENKNSTDELSKFSGHGPFRCASDCDKHKDCAVWTWFGMILKQKGKDNFAFVPGMPRHKCVLRRLADGRTKDIDDDLAFKWKVAPSGVKVISGRRQCGHK